MFTNRQSSKENKFGGDDLSYINQLKPVKRFEFAPHQKNMFLWPMPCQQNGFTIKKCWFIYAGTGCEVIGKLEEINQSTLTNYKWRHFGTVSGLPWSGHLVRMTPLKQQTQQQGLVSLVNTMNKLVVSDTNTLTAWWKELFCSPEVCERAH